ncbi:MAG: response regulator transcription factor [Clostridia bacterium]|nr:response regulator transcription factor [Clostridia bacterium]
MRQRVLIVEDEALMREVIRDYFEKDGYDCDEAETGVEALEQLDAREYDLVLLDIMLPELDGFSVCSQIRKKSSVPVIMITARSDEYDKLAGFESGADDYITKPFSPKVLLAKANALIRRASGRVCGNADEVSAAGIVINTGSHSVFCDGAEVELTPKEYDLLLYLMTNKGRVLTRDTLLSRVWGYDYFGDDRTVDTHIKKLRAKLGDKAVHIKTLIKAGYKFDENA